MVRERSPPEGTRGCLFAPHSDISFQSPVEIGSLLNFSATVVNSQRVLQQNNKLVARPNLIVTEVLAEKVDPRNSSRRLTNRFYFTFSAKTAPNVVRFYLLPYGLAASCVRLVWCLERRPAQFRLTFVIRCRTATKKP